MKSLARLLRLLAVKRAKPSAALPDSERPGRMAIETRDEKLRRISKLPR